MVTGMGSVLIIVAGIVGWSAGGFPNRYTAEDLRVAALLDVDTSPMFRSGQCFLLHEYRERFADECLKLEETKPNYLLLGDSHAAQLWFGFQTVFTHSNFLQATAAKCIPVVDHALGEAANCTEKVDDAFHGFLPLHKSTVVVLAARWKPQHLARMEQTLHWLRSGGTPVVLIGPMPIYDMALPRLIVMANRSHDLGLVDRSWDHSIVELDDQMAALARQQGGALHIRNPRALLRVCLCST